LSLNNQLIFSRILTHSLFTLFFRYVHSLTCKQVSLENRYSLAKIIKEPIPKLKLISPNLEFGDVNRSYDMENIFENIINVAKVAL